MTRRERNGSQKRSSEASKQQAIRKPQAFGFKQEYAQAQPAKNTEKETMPKLSKNPKRSTFRNKTIELADCPTCPAQRGERCHNPPPAKGRRNAPHRERVTLARAEARAHGTVLK